MSKQKLAIKPITENVTFVFSDIRLDNVPFCHKTLSIRMKYSMNAIATEPTPVDNFDVQWTKSIEFTRPITKDALGHINSSMVDVFVYTHTVKGSGKEEIATGKFDLAPIVRNGMKHFDFPLQSNVLESNLHFNIEIKNGRSFLEKPVEEEEIEPPVLPKIIISTKKSWFTFNHNQDSIEADALKLADLSMVPPNAA